MISRPFLFCSGEFRVTMPLVFLNDEWSHSMIAKRFEPNDDGTFRRQGTNERIKGLVYYAHVENEEIRRQNLSFIIDNSIMCWPNARTLLDLENRHEVMKRCVQAGLVNHKVVQVTPGENIDLGFPFVVKTGNSHSGEGKFLVRNAQEIPNWEGLATVEPFFEGISGRVLWIGETRFGTRIDNDASWIKNSSGAEVSLWNEIPKEVVEHSRKVKDLFGLEVCGIDYVIGKDGFHFLEYNQFPGVDVDDSVTPVVTSFFQRKMKEVEQIAKLGYTNVGR